MASAGRDQDGDHHERRVRAEFGQFFKDNYKDLAGFVCRSGGFLLGSEASKDIAEEAMESLFQRLVDPGKGPVNCPRAYVYKCAMNALRKALKSLNKRADFQEYTDDEKGAPKASWGSGPEASYLQHDGLGRMLRQLPTEHQRRVAALLSQGFKPGDIAEILGITPAAARQAKRKVLKHLRETHPAWKDWPDQPEAGEENDR